MTYAVQPPDGQTLSDHFTICVNTFGRPPETIVVARDDGRHSGADKRMTDALFGDDPVEAARLAALECTAGALEGAYAVAVGDAISQAAAHGRPIHVSALLESDISTQKDARSSRSNSATRSSRTAPVFSSLVGASPPEGPPVLRPSTPNLRASDAWKVAAHAT